MKYYIDSHTHITNELNDIKVYMEDVKRAKDENIQKAMMVFTNKEELKLYDSLKDDEYFDFAYGIYPSEKTFVDEEELLALEEEIKTGKYKALGEIGMDYHWYRENKEIQKEVFKRQVILADKYDLPIIIHARDCVEDVLNILKEVNCKRKGVLHCYSGSYEQAKEFIKLGYYISFSGSVTFKNNRKGTETAKNIDLNYLLCETDAPYLAPVPMRGKRNETSYVKYVYDFIADLRYMNVEVLKDIVYDNYYRLFQKEH